MKIVFLLIMLVSISLCVDAQNVFRTACQGNLSRLDSLMTNVSIDQKDDRGRSLLHWAVACKQEKVFHWLIEKGIQFNAEDNQLRTPLHVALQIGGGTFFDELVGLQESDSWTRKYGASLLTAAVLNQDTLSIDKLVDAGVDIDAVNDRGSTALEISQRMGAAGVMDFLISKGADRNKVRQFEMKGEYMGQNAPGVTPEMFAPNFISTEESEFGSVFNKAGTEFYFGVDVGGRNEIRYTQRIGDEWSKPRVILDHEHFGYNDPFLSNDENRLYFISGQTLDGLGENKDIDIWYVEKTEDGWSDPINAGPTINTEGNEYYISFTDQGTMYFSSNGNAPEDRRGSDYDIFYAENSAGIFQEPVPLSGAINTPAYEADVFVAPDESYIIFCSTRDGGQGQGDLYISFKQKNGDWTEAVNMGPDINTPLYEYCPFVTKDGRYLFFTSNQDIYWVSMDIIEKIKSRVRG